MYKDVEEVEAMAGKLNFLYRVREEQAVNDMLNDMRKLIIEDKIAIKSYTQEIEKLQINYEGEYKEVVIAYFKEDLEVFKKYNKEKEIAFKKFIKTCEEM